MAVLVFFACARQSAPTGGPKDTTPPKVDSLVSSPNFSIHFKESRIRLTFDEWVVLKDAPTQVLISPPLAKRPDITLKGKTVTIKFAEGEVLRANTTYAINFGNAVQDLHEGNPAKNLRFVFSTGDFLDSLTVPGRVVDGFTGDPVENLSVMLYDNFRDSVPRMEKPFYLAKTDKTGQFILQNVRAGQFKMVVIEDKDQNLKWNSDNESIAFADTLLTVSSISGRRPITLRLFKDQARFRLFERNANRYGLIKLTYTGSPDSIPLRVEPEVPGLKLLAEKDLDTLLVWYDLPVSSAWQMLARNDTVVVRDLSREDFFKSYRLGFAQEGGAAPATGKFNNRREQPVVATSPKQAQPARNVNQNPAKTGFLKFSAPILTIDTSRWIFKLDSGRVTNFSVQTDSVVLRQLNIILPWKAGKTYNLTLLPGAVTDFYGIRTVDTLRQIFTILSEKQLGGLNLTVNSLVPHNRYVLQLMNGTDLVEQRPFLAETTEKRLVFTNLLTATYTIQLIEDRNGNGRWDTGDYYAHRQPEKIFTKKLEPLRANWEVEATMEALPDTNRKKEKPKTN